MTPETTLAAPLKPGWNPWPIALVAFLSLFASAVVGFGIFAVGHHQDLVRPDYYEHEIRFQEQIDRVARTRELAGSVSVSLTADGRALDLRLPAGAVGTVLLYRPSDARLDRESPLALDPEGRQRLDTAGLKPGLWKARVQWKSGAEEFFHDETVVVPDL